MRSKIVILSLVGVLGASFAFAQGNNWGAYEAAFPKYPCQDGWMGCIQDGERVDPELSSDSTGMPVSADMRVGWFDLEPTPGFSPFVGLSKYTGDGPTKVADGVADATGGDPVDGDPENPDETTKDDGDATADVEFFDPEAERARMEADARRLEEAEARRAEERAREEAERARREEAKAQRQADEQAQAAMRAMEVANAASNQADKQRLQVEAQRQKEEADRARAQAQEAEKLRKEREAREAKEAERATLAAAAAKRAEEDRKQKEASEARQAEERRQAELERQKAAEAEQKRAADEARKKAEDEAAVARAEADKRAREAAAAAAAASDAAERAQLEQAARKAEEDRKKAEDAAKAKAEADAKAAAEAARVKADAEAKAARDAEQLRLEEERKRIEDEEREKRGDPKLEGECSDLLELETVAILGKLKAEQTSCLESNLASATRMTQKTKISRMLMVNAFSAGQTAEWEKLIKRHLQEFEQSDPDLCYKYALHLSKKGVGSQFEVIRWANVALENRTVWTGNTYTQRVYSLFKIRAAASQKIWQHRENKHAANPTEESNQKAKDARNQTKEFSREWYEYAKVAGKDVTTALELCRMAAGTKDYCEAG